MTEREAQLLVYEVIANHIHDSGLAGDLVRHYPEGDRAGIRAALADLADELHDRARERGPYRTKDDVRGLDVEGSRTVYVEYGDWVLSLDDLDIPPGDYRVTVHFEALPPEGDGA